MESSIKLQQTCESKLHFSLSLCTSEHLSLTHREAYIGLCLGPPALSTYPSTMIYSFRVHQEVVWDPAFT